MNNRVFWRAALFAILVLFLHTRAALAHESITVGDYTLEVGWLNEPPVAGQHNAIVVHVAKAEGQPVEDVSSLTITMSYGGQQKSLTLEPVDEHAPGQFMATIVPTIPGQYTVLLGGQLDETTFVDVQVEPEEVQPAETLQFPVSPAAGQNADLGALNWLIYLSLLIGLTALILGVMALRRAGR